MNDAIPSYGSAASWLAAVTRHQPGRWFAQPGIELIHQHSGTGWVVMAEIQPSRQTPGLLRAVLSRRHQYAEQYEGSHLCLNGHNVLIIWWPLPDEPEASPRIIESLSALAGVSLTAADAPAPQTTVADARHC
ncbi:hypothetical protein [Dickeya lacustris]|uniref:Type III secretion protein HrpV n=1 Tax=Dickeya lacustris TaxID=2259638 RepID=A0ABY8G8J5_9GAMM|nr:hypothetical protein [Dickeya lacustris]WFN56230.1 hypothetical protein O1Q98_02660 [Dickeya lacustris]